jgi:alanine dehydrogenase
MIIGVPKEIKEQEHRVGLVPASAFILVRRGHTVLIQKNAGGGSGYSDEEYVNAGAQIVETAQDVYGGADMVVKVKEPLPAEYGLLRKGQILFTYLHLAGSKPRPAAVRK